MKKSRGLKLRTKACQTKMDTAVHTILILLIRNYAKTSTEGIVWSPKWTFLEFRNTAVAVTFLFSEFEHNVLTLLLLAFWTLTVSWPRLSGNLMSESCSGWWDVRGCTATASNLALKPQRNVVAIIWCNQGFKRKTSSSPTGFPMFW